MACCSSWSSGAIVSPFSFPHWGWGTGQYPETRPAYSRGYACPSSAQTPHPSPAASGRVDRVSFCVADLSALSARWNSMSRLPLLLRMMTVMPALHSASTLWTIRRECGLGEMSPPHRVDVPSQFGGSADKLFSLLHQRREERNNPVLQQFRRASTSLRPPPRHCYRSALVPSPTTRCPSHTEELDPTAARRSPTRVRLVSTAPLMAVVPEMRLNTSSAGFFRRWWMKRIARPWRSAICLRAERSR